ncbi:unnamed protein product, partial [Brassica rapa]
RSQDEDKPVVYGAFPTCHFIKHCFFVFFLGVLGRGWKASELRLKSWDDLQKLWYHVLTERAIEEPDPRRSAEMKRMVNAM